LLPSEASTSRRNVAAWRTRHSRCSGHTPVMLPGTLEGWPLTSRRSSIPPVFVPRMPRHAPRPRREPCGSTSPTPDGPA
jgi:hypothetical protein